MLPIIVVEGVPLFRFGMRIELERTGEWVVLESIDCTEIMELAQALQPSCAIIDSGLTTIDPFEVCWALRQQAPQIGILILAQAPDEEQCFQFFRYGANAYEPRTIAPEALIETLRRVACGEFLITSEVLPDVSPRPSARIVVPLKTHPQEEPVSTYPLSSREVEILDHIARGSSNKEIAKSLQISDQTVKNHITSILKKLSVDDRTAAVVYAIRRGWIALELSSATGDSEAARTKTSSVAEGLAI